MISKFRHAALTDLESSRDDDKLCGRILWSLTHNPQSLHVADTHGKFVRKELGAVVYVTALFSDGADPLLGRGLDIKDNPKNRHAPPVPSERNKTLKT
jgi:hypothetical protein